MYLPHQTVPAYHNPDAPQNQTPTVKENSAVLLSLDSQGSVSSQFLLKAHMTPLIIHHWKILLLITEKTCLYYNCS